VRILKKNVHINFIFIGQAGDRVTKKTKQGDLSAAL